MLVKMVLLVAIAMAIFQSVPTKADSEGVQNLANKIIYQDYSFLALLYHEDMPSVMCLGAIVAPTFIIANCRTHPSYEYSSVKVGLNADGEANKTIKILESFYPAGYIKYPFHIDEVEVPTLWSSVSAISVHEVENIEFQEGVISAIEINRKRNIFPTALKVAYLDNGKDIVFRNMPTIDDEECNKVFKQYSSPAHDHIVDFDQFCVYNKPMIGSSACHSQPLMIHEGTLYGVVAWSTKCSKNHGVDPVWVGTSVAHYLRFLCGALQKGQPFECREMPSLYQ